MEPSENGNYVRLLRALLGLVVIFVVLFAAYQFYLSRHFRVVSTSPKISNIAAVSPYLKINFNRQLSSKGLSVSSSYSVIKSYKVQGKTLLVNLKSPMTAGYEYSIKVKSISDTKGEKITNKAFLFTPKNIAYQKLSKDQKAALLQAQANRPPSVSDITFSDIGALVSDGVTNNQATSLRQDFFNFVPKANKVTVTNVVPVPHNRNSSSTNDTINFNVKIDAKTYTARIDYSHLNDYIRLYLYDPTGAQVFDSGAAAQTGE
jgi:hypothetical protein